MVYLNEYFKEELAIFLKDFDRLVILGIGNDIREDDGLGPYIIEKLSENNLNENISLINAGSVPENFTGEIKRENPSHILLIDAVLMNKSPGEFNFIKKEEIINVSVSTHSMSLSYLIKYLEQEKNYNILFIGIQPKSMDLAFDLSEEVKDSADELIGFLNRL